MGLVFSHVCHSISFNTLSFNAFPPGNFVLPEAVTANKEFLQDNILSPGSSPDDAQYACRNTALPLIDRQSGFDFDRYTSGPFNP